MDASDGATLASFTADIDFDVSDTAENIADKVSGEFMQVEQTLILVMYHLFPKQLKT